MIDQGARGLGGVALAPERNAEPIADLGMLAVELSDSAAAEHGAVPGGDQEHDLAAAGIGGGEKGLRVRERVGMRNAQRVLGDAAVVDQGGDRCGVLEPRCAQYQPLGLEDRN